MAVSISTRSKFSALKVEGGESSSSRSESESSTPTLASKPLPKNANGSTSGNSTPSKVNRKTAAARKRALLAGSGVTGISKVEEDKDASDATKASTSTSTSTPNNNNTKSNSTKYKPNSSSKSTPTLPSKPVEPVEAVESASSDEDGPEEPAGTYTEEEEDASDLEPEPKAQPQVQKVISLKNPTPSPSPSPSPLLSTSSLPLSSTSISTPTTTYTGADHDPKKKLTAIIQRTTYGLLMACCLVAIICLGHVYVIALVFVCQAVVFSELSGLFDAGYSSGNGAGGEGKGEEKESSRSREREERRRGRREERDRWSKRISWYFFAATNYFLYGESLIYYFKHILTLRASFLPTTFSFAQHHRLISFGLYLIGFVSFVANLTRAQLRRQFGLFGWIHMSLLLVVVSSHFMVNNILEGLIWFWVPASLVIMNDIAAYVCGMAFGRHQLIKLSPKKTVEGFVGAFFVTIAFAVVWGTFFMRFNYMICPVTDLATNVFSDIECIPNQTFVWRNFVLPNWLREGLSLLTSKTITSIPWAPFQLHTIVLAIFASLVAPFGGFFASGFKRAFNIKDFGASIPGHGGVTDRMDCQFLMGLFSYVYYASLIRETHITVASVLSTALTALSTEEQLELISELGKTLATKGIKAVVNW